MTVVEAKRLSRVWRGGLIPVLYAVADAATMAQVVTTPVVDTWLLSLAERELSLPLVGDTARTS
ncbi:hypothetical protein PsorP6_009758 [Peronosclerospora sorghi]|uniref:Uncharacterized protein n=1 Tax=Peronosclerospora sorghi TaxID=230839 RepID=A0ACC0W295_9STRA|nr:hypothetical protein PsorP6_009758 [Peronosclerospora sorghi]